MSTGMPRGSLRAAATRLAGRPAVVPTPWPVMRLHPWAGMGSRMGRRMGRRMGLLIGLCMGLGLTATHAAVAKAEAPPAAATRAGAAAPALACSLRPAQPVLGHVLRWEIQAR